MMNLLIPFLLIFFWLLLGSHAVVAAAWIASSSSSSKSFSTTSTTTTTTTTSSVTPRWLVSTSQIAILDGAEWNSFQECCCVNSSPAETTTTSPPSPTKNFMAIRQQQQQQRKKFGYVTIVVGSIPKDDNPKRQQPQQQQRVIGIQAMPSLSTSSSSSSFDANNKDDDDDDDDDDVMVVSLSNQVSIYRDSMAYISSSSSSIKDIDAISTYLAAMSINCCLPRIDNVGGSSSSSSSTAQQPPPPLQSNTVSSSSSSSSSFVIPGSKVVVLGGSDFACFAAEGLATLGALVSLVTTRRSPKIRHSNVQVLTPAVGELQLGFCAVIGQFDAMLDTLHDERKKPMELLYQDNDDDDNDEDDLAFSAISASVVPLLAQRHSCTRYFSTLTQAQQIVREGGVLFGPRQADDHVKSLYQQLLLSDETRNRAQFQYFGPSLLPVGLGQTVQTLFDKGLVLPNTSKKMTVSSAGGGNNKNSQTSFYARGWSLSDFWEYTTWPRDTTGDVRYGLPVLTESEFGFMRAATVQASTKTSSSSSKVVVANSEESESYNNMEGANDGDDDESLQLLEKNPFVMDIANLEELQRDIVSSQRDCVLFLSASYCRTCRYLQPAFTRLARTTLSETAAIPSTTTTTSLTNNNNNKGNKNAIVFAKAETSGPFGKELGRALAVDAVPTFLFFRNGRRYGVPLPISKLPSKKLNLAISLLTNGMPWDQAAFQKLEEGGGGGGGSGDGTSKKKK